MIRLGELDLPDRLAPMPSPWATQIGFGLLCAGAATMIRALIDAFSFGAGPFAVGYPLVMIATLFARWKAGAVAAVATVLYAWYFSLPVYGSFTFADPADLPRLIVNAIAYALIVGLAELFRLAVRNATQERDREIAQRDLYLQEFEHRVKNNFMLVTGMLDLQRRRSDDPATVEALGAALNRVESIARAHRHLYAGSDAPGTVDMAIYLSELCAALADALSLRAAIALECVSEHVALPRDRAVAIGLVLNELATNAAKHAFPGRDVGTITAQFTRTPDGYRLSVIDDGVGMSPETLAEGRAGGLGKRLVDAFARQAGGTLVIDSGTRGTVAVLNLDN
ncbi:sensor histidine kinase [Sphingomonas sp.]|uniref:sensor histidine kinase n=1 Tax=Sphingomonas sp. TaxID=28214 RepID=UPI001EBA1FAA|nr:sensor histidine kinase [Sphingomonas sp.]MBX3595615.1 sensor histidine kinase [Sphingomonas sp.]